MDGGFQSVSKLTRGVGVIVHDEEGSYLATFAHSFSPVISALHMEVEACRAGLLIALHQGWTDIDLESDCSLVVAALTSSTEDCPDIGRILEDCKVYM